MRTLEFQWLCSNYASWIKKGVWAIRWAVWGSHFVCLFRYYTAPQYRNKLLFHSIFVERISYYACDWHSTHTQWSETTVCFYSVPACESVFSYPRRLIFRTALEILMVISSVQIMVFEDFLNTLSFQNRHFPFLLDWRQNKSVFHVYCEDIATSPEMQWGS